MEQQSILYFDMDGVLADFDGQYTRLTGKPWEHRLSETRDEKWAGLKDHPYFFRDLPWIPGVQAVLCYLVKTPHPFALGVLSAASQHIPESRVQKLEWCARELRWMEKHNVVIVERKHDKVKYASGNLLVDDCEENINAWVEAGGRGIHFLNAEQLFEEIQAIDPRAYKLVPSNVSDHPAGTCGSFMSFGKQIHYCANCGKRLYDSRIDMKRSMCNNMECYKEYEMKYAASILGKDAEPPESDK